MSLLGSRASTTVLGLIPNSGDLFVYTMYSERRVTGTSLDETSAAQALEKAAHLLKVGPAQI